MSELEKAIEYYTFQKKKIVNLLNEKNTFNEYDLIQFGEELAVLEHKLTALEVAQGESLS